MEKARRDKTVVPQETVNKLRWSTMASSSATGCARQSMRSLTLDHPDSRRSGLCCCKLVKQSLTRQQCRSPTGREPVETIRKDSHLTH